ncbi:hypothetical protein Acr_20g0011160 [Actinidia rufa]|uniref:Dehydrin family protein n=1 Tax=Actinidia rufa TaxID=165716 RepID=A0A7J0GF20_9ERIC|nr:hypothetical protein Acr_20g0011160 [Actinidia rufa]
MAGIGECKGEQIKPGQPGECKGEQIKPGFPGEGKGEQIKPGYQGECKGEQIKPGHPGERKEGITDKIKDKLHGEGGHEKGETKKCDRD